MKVVNWFANIEQWDPNTTAVGLSTVVFLIVLKRFERLVLKDRIKRKEFG